MNLPNFLTGLRLAIGLAMPVVVLVIGGDSAVQIVAILFAIAAFTDFADGQIARRSGQVTNIGRILDPAADKAATLISLFILCTVSDLRMAILLPASILITRDALISVLRESGHDLPSSQIAKAKTAVLTASILLLLIGDGWKIGDSGTADQWLEGLARLGIIGLWLSSALAVATGARYAASAFSK